MERVKSVLVVDHGEVPPRVYQRLEQQGWICAHTPDMPSAMEVLHQVRPALVLIGHEDEARDGLAMRTLQQDPFMAGVQLAVLRNPADASAVAQQLQELIGGRE